MTEVVQAVDEPVAPSLVQKLAAEFIGTMILVVIGCGAATGLSNGDVDPAAFVGTVGLAFGLAIVVAVYAFGRVSGGHFNPAVSVGAALGGRVAWKDAGLYVVAQIIGAIVGALVIFVVFKGFDGFSASDNGLGRNGFGDDYNHMAWWGALIAEIVLTAIFVLIILAVTDVRNPAQRLAPLAIGLSLSAIHFVGIAIDGTSVNPARSIGPALFSGSEGLKDLWLFIVAPLIGAAISGLLYPLIFGHGSDPVPGSGLKLGGGGGAADQAFAQQWGQQPAAQQPIIQDGWQWDPATQQWIPAPQAPAAPPAPQAAQPPLGGEVQGGWQPPQDGGEHTMVRPPQ